MNIDKWGGLSYTSAASSNYIWGGNNIELLNLEDNTGRKYNKT